MKPCCLIAAALANKPFNGGNAWSRLGWILGFRRLGYEVYFVEQISRDKCVDGEGAATAFGGSVNREYFRDLTEQFGLSEWSSLICGEGDEVFGVPLTKLEAVAAESSFLLNMSGHLAHDGLLGKCGLKVYLDDDPGYTQFWQAAGDGAARMNGHDAYFTIGRNIGSPSCLIPTGNIQWKHTRPPADLEQWPVVQSAGFDRFTTVASWRGGYAPILHEGRKLGQKAHEFRKFFSLPSRTGRQFEVALDIHPGDHKDIAALGADGWRLVDPKAVAKTAQAYRSYIQTSGAEFSPAQGVYVETNSGWFSDRTVRYLATGKPVLVQETGFSQHYPTGEGLLSFRNLEEAIEGVERITGDYRKHCLAARKLAEDYFDSDKVIGDLLAQIGLKPG
ncbi:MAG TPA: hypothetical protein VJA21_28135 [Verrucomicrobiae bacterium]